VLQRPLVRVHLEIVAYAVLIILSVVAHLWQLDQMAMHHDESIHAWASWNYYTGQGGFDCAGNNPDRGIERTSPSYCYSPTYHGPSLYMLTLLSYFLFGDGDAQARLPMAMAGIGLVASCWMLRPLMGRPGAFLAAVLLAFSPALLYYTRFARHDGLMVLWELWMVIGIFRYLQSGQVRYFYLMALGVILAIGTHELYYILFFIFGIFVLVRLLAESRAAPYLNSGLLAMLAVCAVLMVLNPQLPFGKGLYLGEKALLVAIALLTAWFSQHGWYRSPLLLLRLSELWHQQRRSLWIALAMVGGLYLVMYTNFLTYPRGAFDGLYAGLAYWLGSQQDFARGDQPWYYYLMQLPLYEPLAVVSGIGSSIYLYFFARWNTDRGRQQEEPAPQHTEEQDHARDGEQTVQNKGPGAASASSQKSSPPAAASSSFPSSLWGRFFGEGSGGGFSLALPAYQEKVSTNLVVTTLFPLLLLFWFINAVVIFSWAGEKMPWLLTHLALPGNLVAAWALGSLVSNVRRSRSDASDASAVSAASDAPGTPDHPHDGPAPGWFQRVAKWLVPPAFLLILVVFGVAMWRLHLASVTEGRAAQSSILQAVIPLLTGGVLVYAVLTIGAKIGARVLLSLLGLTLAAVLGAYMLRSTWLVVYHHPDTPIEPMIYTQTAPEIPRYVEDMEKMSRNLTRSVRTEENPAGGMSMPIIVDSGDENGDGSLAWPLQWYLRHFTNIQWKKAPTLKEAIPDSFEVDLPSDGRGLAPVVMLYKSHVDDALETFLKENYVQPYGESGSLNWWFPEGNKCSPDGAGYKKFYYNSWTSSEEEVKEACGQNTALEDFPPPWAPLVWPFVPQHWDTLTGYVLYRDLPPSLQPGSRVIEIWVRNDLVHGIPSDMSGTSRSGPSVLPLLATQAIGSAEELAQPTGLAVDRQGRVYVADTGNHRIQVFDADGSLEQTIGSFGQGEGQFHEPRGVAVDRQGNIYVADTWNARIVKLSRSGRWLRTWGEGDEDLGNGRMVTRTGATQEGNLQAPLGFFGPRGVAVDADGNVYIVDTGNKRIVVTDDEGTYLYQWGAAGSEAGKFNEPTTIAFDSGGNAYVADTWNGRVQVFPRDMDDRVSPIPIVTWSIGGWEPDTYLDPSIGVHPDSIVYASVPARHTVLSANMRGDILFRWGGEGDDMGSLTSPAGVAVGPEGDVFVVDRARARVLRFEVPPVRMSGGGEEQE
jgi:uncharacterized protein (TIGR03663 family)